MNDQRTDAVSRRDRRKNTPAAFLSAPRPEGRVIVCIGDSITAADMSSDWVARLRQRFSGRRWTFINAGVNGNLAWNVLQRVDSVVACKPDAVLVLVGTNDVGATVNERTTRSMMKQQQLPRRPDIEWFAENVAAILSRLREDTEAQVIAVEIPPLGEELNGEMNRRVATYNQVLRTIAATHSVDVLPLSAALRSRIPTGHHPAPYAHRVWPMLRAVIEHTMFGRSWDDISRRNGLVVLTDWVHLNDRAGGVLAQLTGDFLDRTLRN